MVHEREKSDGVRIEAVDPEMAGQRIDNFLSRELKGVPKSHIYKILRRGEVRVNGKRVKPTTRLQGGDQVRIPPVRTRQPMPTIGVNANFNIEKTIVYEDKLMLVVNKPSGLAVHGGSGLSYGLIELLRQVRPDQQLELAHRLDRDTSGLMIVAKRRSFLRHVHALLREGDSKLKKRYLAVVIGKWPNHLQEIRAPILKNTNKGGERFSRVAASGKAAETRFRVHLSAPMSTLEGISADQSLSVVEASLMTGRTHQVRVHCNWSGMPIVGDRKYMGDEQNPYNSALHGAGYRRLMLHAWSLSIPDMDGGKPLQLTAEPEGSMAALIKGLGGSELIHSTGS